MALANIISKLLPSLKKGNIYNYALYLGESGWGNSDLLILLNTNGNVKFIGDAHYKDERKTPSFSYGNISDKSQ